MPVPQFVVSADLAYPAILRVALAAADAMDLARRQLTRLAHGHHVRVARHGQLPALAAVALSAR
jgi:hypothetical protein